MLSIVIPCYNEEDVIIETNKILSKLTEIWIDKKILSSYEVIYVNDGSKDNTLNILKNIAYKNQNIKIISLSNNFGHQAALTAGLHHASGDVIVTLDADLQDPPEVIENMIEKYREGYEIVYGVRKERQEDSFFKRVTAHSFYKLMKWMGVNFVYNHADFRLISNDVLREFKGYGEINRFIRGMFPMLGFHPTMVEYNRVKRFAGETKYPFKKMLAFAIEGITSFSPLPLRLASFLGLTLFLGTLILMLWAMITRLSGHAIPGWASIVLPLYFLGGIQLIFFGIMGEYIAKIYMEVKRRPLYIIKEKFNFEV